MGLAHLAQPALREEGVEHAEHQDEGAEGDLRERYRPWVAQDVQARHHGEEPHEAIDVVGRDVEGQIKQRQELLMCFLDRLVQVIGLRGEPLEAFIVAAEAGELALAARQVAEQPAQAPQIAFRQREVALQPEDGLEKALGAVLRSSTWWITCSVQRVPHGSSWLPGALCSSTACSESERRCRSETRSSTGVRGASPKPGSDMAKAAQRALDSRRG